MSKLFIILMLLTGLVSCSSIPKASTSTKNERSDTVEDILDRAEANATIAGRKILEVSRTMIASQEIVVGGCWNYINTVYNRVGYSENQRNTIFKGKLRGPYTQSDMVILPGDWLYFVNHTYHDIEHSAIFVAWTDVEKKVALMISYAGEKKLIPATYKQFTLDNIYNVIRVSE